MFNDTNLFFKIHEQFKLKIVEIDIFQREYKKLAEDEFKSFSKALEAKRSSEHPGELFVSFYNVLSLDLTTNKKSVSKQIDINLEEIQERIFFRKNKQYQWLLAEAYEAFEDFLEETYAALGLFDHDFWGAEELENLQVSELGRLKFEWFCKKSRARKKGAIGILKKLREKLSIDQQIHRDISSTCNVFGSIVMIEKFRHAIVHNHGFVKSKEEVTRKILETCGESKDGLEGQVIVDDINCYLARGKYENLVVLLEIDGEKTGPFTLQHSIFGHLLYLISGYADLIKEACFQKFAQTRSSSS